MMASILLNWAPFPFLRAIFQIKSYSIFPTGFGPALLCKFSIGINGKVMWIIVGVLQLLQVVFTKAQKQKTGHWVAHMLSR